jgi:prevent-host-death family protein
VKTLSLTQAKSKLGGLVDRVHTLGEEILITRHGRPAAILVSPAKFESWRETAALRKDASFLNEIRTGLASLKAGRAKLYTLDELLR